MAGQPRRIELMSSEPLNPTKKKTKTSSVRFQLDLSAAEGNYSEISYLDLLKKSGNGVDIDTSLIDPEDPFSAKDAAEHEQMLAVARSYEVKYGKADKVSKKRRKYDRVQDLVDLGDGYDESDAFIDNSEAYDEIVPACMTTKYGGFYINSGQLDFRVISGGESDNEEEVMVKKKRKKKMRMITDSDDEGSMKRLKKKTLKDKKRKGFGGGSEFDRLKKKRKLSHNKLMKRQALSKKSMNGLKKSCSSLSDTSISSVVLAGTEPITSLALAGTEPINAKNNNNNHAGHSKQSGANSISTTSAPIITQGGTVMIHAFSDESSMESLSGHVDSTTEKTGGALLKPSISIADNCLRSDSPHPENAPKLPDTLPEKVKLMIEQIKQAAVHAEGKSKFFTTPINHLLLEIDSGIRPLPASTRQCVFTHLAAYLPVGKATLIGRAKKLRQNEKLEAGKTLEPLVRALEQAVNEAMPQQLARYKLEYEAAMVSHGKLTECKDEPKEEGGSTESDEEEKKDGEPKKRFKAPHRKFHFTEKIRALLCTIVQSKLEEYDTTKSGKSPEEYLKNYFETELKFLWTKGWMQARTLFKETRSIHAPWTNAAIPVTKVKRPAVSTTNKPSCIASTNNKTAVSVSSKPISLPTSKPAVLTTPSVMIAKLKSPDSKPIIATTTSSNFTTTTTNSSLLDYANNSFNASAKVKAGDPGSSVYSTSKHSGKLSMGTVIKDELYNTSTTISGDPMSLKPLGSFGFNSSSVNFNDSIEHKLSSLVTSSTVQEKSISSSSNNRQQLAASQQKKVPQYDQVSSTSKRPPPSSTMNHGNPSSTHTAISTSNSSLYTTNNSQRHSQCSSTDEPIDVAKLFGVDPFPVVQLETMREKTLLMAQGHHSSSSTKQHNIQSSTQGVSSANSLLSNITSSSVSKHGGASSNVQTTQQRHKPAMQTHQPYKEKVSGRSTSSTPPKLNTPSNSNLSLLGNISSSLSQSQQQQQYPTSSSMHMKSPPTNYQSRQPSSSTPHYDNRNKSPQKQANQGTMSPQAPPPQLNPPQAHTQAHAQAHTQAHTPIHAHQANRNNVNQHHSQMLSSGVRSHSTNSTKTNIQASIITPTIGSMNTGVSVSKQQLTKASAATIQAAHAIYHNSKHQQVSGHPQKAVTHATAGQTVKFAAHLPSVAKSAAHVTTGHTSKPSVHATTGHTPKSAVHAAAGHTSTPTTHYGFNDIDRAVMTQPRTIPGNTSMYSKASNHMVSTTSPADYLHSKQMPAPAHIGASSLLESVASSLGTTSLGSPPLGYQSSRQLPPSPGGHHAVPRSPDVLLPGFGSSHLAHPSLGYSPPVTLGLTQQQQPNQSRQHHYH